MGLIKKPAHLNIVDFLNLWGFDDYFSVVIFK